MCGNGGEAPSKWSQERAAKSRRGMLWWFRSNPETDCLAALVLNSRGSKNAKRSDEGSKVFSTKHQVVLTPVGFVHET